MDSNQHEVEKSNLIISRNVPPVFDRNNTSVLSRGIDSLGRFINYKIKQVKYSNERGIKTAEFLLGNMKTHRRREFYELWRKRGVTRAEELGIRIPTDLPTWAFNDVFGDQVYIKDGFVPERGDRVLDIGAQFGDYSAMCSKIYGVRSVHAFEPLKSNTYFIKQILSMNDIDNVHIHEIGLSNTERDEDISYDGDMLEFGVNGSKKQSIHMGVLDSFDLECDIVKIDVEGYEMEVLAGGLNTIKSNLPKIIIETHSAELKKSVLNLLKPLGYRVEHSIGNHLLTGGLENLFLSAKKVS